MQWTIRYKAVTFIYYHYYYLLTDWLLSKKPILYNIDWLFISFQVYVKFKSTSLPLSLLYSFTLFLYIFSFTSIYFLSFYYLHTIFLYLIRSFLLVFSRVWFIWKTRIHFLFKITKKKENEKKRERNKTQFSFNIIKEQQHPKKRNNIKYVFSARNKFFFKHLTRFCYYINPILPKYVLYALIIL